MPNRPPVIWRFTDGKAGHENQSLALVENLQNLAPFNSQDLHVTRLRDVPRADSTLPTPSLVVGAGHRTHLPILCASRRFDCPSVVLMKPTVPTAFFDLCLIPEHDLTGPTPDNIISTRGMLNRIPPTSPPKQERGLVLIGGPSRHHGWDPDPLRRALRKILTARPQLDWHLTDSRRTPEGFLDSLANLPATLHPSAQTGPDWLPAQLLAARDVWVTEDSMSMIYEALTARARVGLLPMLRKNSRNRIVRGLDRLIAGHWTCLWNENASPEPPAPPAHLHEASRCAREVLHRFFPSAS